MDLKEEDEPAPGVVLKLAEAGTDLTYIYIISYYYILIILYKKNNIIGRTLIRVTIVCILSP